MPLRTSGPLVPTWNGAAPPRESAATTEALGSAEEAHHRCPEGRSEQLPARRAIQLGEGASKAKHRPPWGFEGRCRAEDREGGVRLAFALHDFELSVVGRVSLRQLREQGAKGDDDGLGVGEAVDRLVR
jgi:hypothetical protein